MIVVVAFSYLAGLGTINSMKKPAFWLWSGIVLAFTLISLSTLSAAAVCYTDRHPYGGGAVALFGNGFYVC